MLNDLPVEISLHVFSYLPLTSISIGIQVSRSWKQFIDANESSIYRCAAFINGYIPSPSTSFSDLGTKYYSQRSLAGVTGWKSFCWKRLGLQRSWTGRGPSTVRPHLSAGSKVHRIKVDEKVGIIITTSYDGGLIVADLNNNEKLWSLSQSHVSPYAHCEYDAGFLVITRGTTNSKEVWRLADDFDGTQERSSTSPPDAAQERAYSDSVEMYSSARCNRGHFRPWALLTTPERSRALRFVFPVLAVPSWNNVYLWDVRTGEMIQTVKGTQHQRPITGPGSQGPLGQIHYVELSDRHVFLCGSRSLRIFSRTTGKCVLDIPSSSNHFADWKVRLAVPNSFRTFASPDAALVPHQLHFHYSEPDDSVARIHDRFHAVHVSSCGSHLVALTSRSKLIVIRNFELVESGEVDLWAIAVEVQLGSAFSISQYLAYQNGRIAVATDRAVFVVEVSGGISGPAAVAPRVTVLRIPNFGDPSYLRNISCLQITDTGLFLNWNPSHSSVDFEFSFYQHLQQPITYAVFPDGDMVVMADPQELPADVGPMMSSVYSIDFV